MESTDTQKRLLACRKKLKARLPRKLRLKDGKAGDMLGFRADALAPPFRSMGRWSTNNPMAISKLLGIIGILF